MAIWEHTLYLAEPNECETASSVFECASIGSGTLVTKIVDDAGQNTTEV